MRGTSPNARAAGKEGHTKTLFTDIEVSPTLATVWGLFNQNIALNQLLGNSEVLTWAASWGDGKIVDGDLLRDGKRKMLKNLWALFNEADAVVTWNGDDFDLKILNKEWLLLGLPPPAPYKSIDLIRVSRGKFRFTSNKLAHVADQLKTARKHKNRGHELWLDCMSRKPKAFAEMRRYNRGDLPPLVGIYKKFRPWMTNHPNVNLYGANYTRPKCTACGNPDVRKVKNRVRQKTVIAQWQCKDVKCGHYFTDAPKKKAA